MLMGFIYLVCSVGLLSQTNTIISFFIPPSCARCYAGLPPPWPPKDGASSYLYQAARASPHNSRFPDDSAGPEGSDAGAMCYTGFVHGLATI